MRARRAPEEFSLSFLDVICCGFGAVIPPWLGHKSRAVTVANPPEPVSTETRTVELEIKAPDAATGRYRLPGYALYYVCEDANGTCL